MDLPSFSFSKLNSAKIHIALGGAAAVTYTAWSHSFSPDMFMGLINDPATIITTTITTLDPWMLVPPFGIAGGLFATIRVVPKIVKAAGGRIKDMRSAIPAGSLTASGVTDIKTRFFFSKKPKNGDHPSLQQQQSSSKTAGENGDAAAAKPSAQTKPSENASATAHQGIGERKTMDKTTEAQGTKQTVGNNGNSNGNGSNISALNELIEKKTSAVSEEIVSVKKEIDAFRGDIDQMRSDLRQITSTFETSLVELKAFQAEMVNPINFMRKYIETLEIKSLSDPVNTVRPLENIRAAESSEAQTPRPFPKSYEGHDSSQAPTANIPPPHPSTPDSVTMNETYNDAKSPPEMGYVKREPQGANSVRTGDSRTTHALPTDFRPTLVKKNAPLAEDPRTIMAESIRFLTPGKIMSIVAVIDEMLATMGPDGIELVIEQYRAIGMKPEEERLIYGVLRMLNESKLQTDDIIAIFYRFGQVLGINDEEAELQYMKLVANRKVGERASSGGLPKSRTASTGGD